MKFYLLDGESIIWKGRSAYPLRYPLLSVIFFFGIALDLFGLVGVALAVISFFLFLGFGLMSVIALLRYPRTTYYVTTKRVVSDMGELPLENMGGTRIHQSSLNRVRKIGELSFDSIGYSWLVFKRVKNPETVRQYALTAKANLPKPPPRVPIMQPVQQPTVPIAPSQVAARPAFEQQLQQGSPSIREREVVIREILVLCPYCGTRNPQGIRRCSNCGARI